MCVTSRFYLWQWLVHDSYMTCFYVWHDSFLPVAYSFVRVIRRLPMQDAFHFFFFICVRSLIPTVGIRMCMCVSHLTHSDMYHDSFRCVTWLFHKQILFVRVTWLIPTVGTLMCMCHTWRIPICTTTYFDVWHDSSIRKYHFYVWHDSFLPWAYSCVWVTWRIPICTTAHFYVWHDLSTRNGRIRELSHGSFIGSHSHLHVRARSISMCDMTPLKGTDNFAGALSHGSFRSTYAHMYSVISTRVLSHISVYIPFVRGPLSCTIHFCVLSCMRHFCVSHEWAFFSSWCISHFYESFRAVHFCLSHSTRLSLSLSFVLSVSALSFSLSLSLSCLFSHYLVLSLSPSPSFPLSLSPPPFFLCLPLPLCLIHAHTHRSRRIGGTRSCAARAGGGHVWSWPQDCRTHTWRTWPLWLSCSGVFVCAAACCSILYCFAVSCSMVQCVIVCCSALQCVALCCRVL